MLGQLQENADSGAVPHVARALCLPNEVILPEQTSWNGIPRAHLFSANDLATPAAFAAAWRRSFPEPDTEVRPKQTQHFLNALGSNSQPEKLREFTDHTEAMFREQIVSRYELLDVLAGNRQLLIEGGCGTGKTWLAIEQAVRYAESPNVANVANVGTASNGDNGITDDGSDVLFLCYNKALTIYVRELLGRRPLQRGTITVLSWEELADQVLADCEIPNSPPDPATASSESMRAYYEQEMPGLLMTCATEAALRFRLRLFDALVVDEAQDHDTRLPDTIGAPADTCGWWTLYTAMLNEGNAARMALFYDCPQRPPFRDHGAFDPQALAATLTQPAFVRLPAAVRYTRQIFDYLRSLQGEGTDDLIASFGSARMLPEGPPVETVHYTTDDASDAIRVLEALLKRWRDSGLCEPHDVLILHVRKDLAATPLGGCTRLLNLPLVETSAAEVESQSTGNSKPAIRHTTIHKAKGLDARGVVLVGLHPFEELNTASFRHTFFMGASRAKQLLGIVIAKQ